MALRGKVIDLVWLKSIQKLNDICGIRNINQK